MNELLEIQTVPLAAFEAQAQRYHQLLTRLIIGWAVTVAFLVGALAFSGESVEDTDETSTTVSQSADNSGSNYYANGDLTIDSTSNGDTN